MTKSKQQREQKQAYLAICQEVLQNNSSATPDGLAEYVKYFKPAAKEGKQ